ncbi:phage tail tape measure protein [Barnesiella intestinihominis]|uniref:phage tail tape measure protein n=1 Tax=Barnesiella intestinihominis TaxID=487174 RepID=UPI003AB59B92
MADNQPIKYKDLISPDNSIEELIKQLTELKDTYTDALASIKAEAIQLAATLQKVSGATEDGRKTTKKAADDAERLARAQRDLAFAESENAKKLAELKLAQQEANQINKLIVKINQSAEGSYNRLSAQYSLNKIYLNNMTKAERENTEEGRKLVAQTKEIYEEMKRLQEATGKFQLNVGNYTEASDAIIAYGDKLKETLGLNSAFGESLLALGRGGAESKAVFTAIGDGAKALGKTLLGLLSNPVFLAIAGIAAAGAAFKWWYDYNAGLVEATRLTQQFTGKSGDDLKAFRNEVQAVADSFNADFRETLIATNALSKQFGISANEALQLVKDGFLSGADANGEFLDTLKEYPAYFKEAGISADQFVAIVAQTNKMGIFSDKGVDAIKEANLRLREMTTATAAALDGIGISSEQVQKDLQTGAKTTFDVMRDISAKLNELPDSATQVGTAIADIFGGPGEDAGLQYLRTLKDISTNMDEVKGKAGLLGQLQEEQLQSQIELQNALSGLFDATGGNFETLTTQAKVFVNQGLTAIIKGVIDVVNYFIELYNESVLIRAIWNGIVAGFKTTFDTLGNLFGLFIDIVKATGTALKGAFTLDFDDVKKGLSDYAAAYGNLVKAQVKDITQNFKEGLDDMQKKIKPITIPVSVGDTPKEPTGNKPVTTQNPTVTPRGKSDAEKAAEQQAKQIEAAYKKNLEATRKLQDAQLQLETDEWAKRRQQTQYQYSRQIEDLQHQLQTEKDLNETGRQAINATITALEQQQTEALLKIEQDRQLQELALQKESIELRLQAVKEGSEQERQLRMQLLENERQTALLQNQQKPTGQQQDAGAINASFDAKGAGIVDEYLQAQLQIFDQQQALAQSEFDLLRNSEARKTQFRLQAEKERLQKVLELNQQAANKLSDVEVQTIQNTIKKIDQEIEQSKGEERGTDIYGLFGLNLDDNQKEAINTSMQYALDALNTFTAARVAAADAAVEQADKEVSAAQSALDAELEARANGYANNVVQAQKELDLAKKNQEKALKEQQKAQKQQAAIQTLQQIGNMVTATALIWSQLGFPFAIPAIAVMWASFAASKIKAAQLAKQTAETGGTETYGDGTVELLEGGSHQSGNDIDLGTKPDGTRRRAEGGEFFAVINKRSSRRFRKIIPDVINSLNNGTFAHKYLKSYSDGDGLTLNVTGQSPDLRNLSDDVREIKEQNQRRVYVDGDGNTIESYKNLKRKIKRL